MKLEKVSMIPRSRSMIHVYKMDNQDKWVALDVHHYRDIVYLWPYIVDYDPSERWYRQMGWGKSIQRFRHWSREIRNARETQEFYHLLEDPTPILTEVMLCA